MAFRRCLSPFGGTATRSLYGADHSTATGSDARSVHRRIRRAYDLGYPSTGSSHRTQRTFATSASPSSSPAPRDGPRILDLSVSAVREVGRRPRERSASRRPPPEGRRRRRTLSRTRARSDVGEWRASCRARLACLLRSLLSRAPSPVRSRSSGRVRRVRSSVDAQARLEP
jgi:hypothetical protein